MITIIQNEQKPWSISLDDDEGEPFNLTGNVEITVCFKTASQVTILTKTGGEVTVDDLILGKISGNLTQPQTDAMPKENSGLVEVEVDFGAGKVRKTQILNAFRVADKAC